MATYLARNKIFFFNLQFQTRFCVNISQQVTAKRGGWWWRVWQFCVNWRQQRVSAWCFTFLKEGEDDTVFMRTRTNSRVRLSSKMISILDIFVWNKFSYKNLIFRPKSSGAERETSQLLLIRAANDSLGNILIFLSTLSQPPDSRH